MRKYFVDTMPGMTSEPEKDHRFVYRNELVSLQKHKRRKDSFTVRYGKQVTAEMNYSQAAAELGLSLMHQLTCDGKMD